MSHSLLLLRAGFNWLSILTVDQQSLASHVVFCRGEDDPETVQSRHKALWNTEPAFGHVEPFTKALLELKRLLPLAQNISCLKILRPQIMLFTMLEQEGRVPVRRLFIRSPAQCSLVSI